MKSLQNKTVFLTGAASGIGRELARQLAVQQCHLYLVDIDATGLKSIQDELADREQSTWTRVCDLTSSKDISAALVDFERRSDVADIVINNAGVAFYGPTETMTPEQWQWLMNINLLAPIQITTHLLPQLLTRPESAVVNMCSIAGLVAGGRFAAYHTSKFGLVGFTEALRAEYGRKGVGVTAICPGPVITNLYDSAQSGRPDGSIPVPPAWASATAEKVARLTVKAIRRNQRQVLITPMAHGVSRFKRFFPGILDWISQFSRSKKKRIAELEAQEQIRLANLPTPQHRRAA